jgi:hypothetical protein
MTRKYDDEINALEEFAQGKDVKSIENPLAEIENNSNLEIPLQNLEVIRLIISDSKNKSFNSDWDVDKSFLRKCEILECKVLKDVLPYMLAYRDYIVDENNIDNSIELKSKWNEATRITMSQRSTWDKITSSIGTGIFITALGLYMVRNNLSKPISKEDAVMLQTAIANYDKPQRLKSLSVLVRLKDNQKEG